jgi:hypothetical protein
MKKITDVLSRETVEFSLTFGETKETFLLNRFSIDELVKIEDEYNVRIDDLQELMEKQPAKWGTTIGWLLLDNKEFFDNDIVVFRRSLDFIRLNELSIAVFKAFSDSQAKNEAAESKTPQKKRK